ncbi:MAG: thioredoxin family protein, partial [Bacteroides sp.]
AIAALKGSPTISKLIAEKKLSVLALYPDEELEEWQKHQNEFPDQWINGYDKKLTIKTESRYDLRAIPTLYLLDKDKVVLLKDAPAVAIEEYLNIHP